jgi:hypothetical protein
MQARAEEVGQVPGWQGGMTRPDSLLTRLRRQLARIIEPGPDPGEAWCLDCALNEGRTLIVSADGFRDHAGQHASGERVRIQVAWPTEPEEVQ